MSVCEVFQTLWPLAPQASVLPTELGHLPLDRPNLDIYYTISAFLRFVQKFHRQWREVYTVSGIFPKMFSINFCITIFNAMDRLLKFQINILDNSLHVLMCNQEVTEKCTNALCALLTGSGWKKEMFNLSQLHSCRTFVSAIHDQTCLLVSFYALLITFYAL
jgi:hypothetical protein